ncbi:MAG: DUF2283 domain-containing protein [Anaerolineae bacterium]
MATLEIDRLLRPLSPLLALSRHIWIDYDEEADVLYVSFRKPQQATDSELDDDVIYHYRQGELVGLTIVGLRDRLATAASLS